MLPKKVVEKCVITEQFALTEKDAGVKKKIEETRVLAHKAAAKFKKPEVNETMFPYFVVWSDKLEKYKRPTTWKDCILPFTFTIIINDRG